MKRFAFVMLAVTLSVSGPAAQDLERLFKAAVNTETVDRNCRAAIEQYRKVAAGSDRSLAAQAFLRMAQCHQQLGDAEATRIYERLVRDFADQRDVAAQAKARLQALAPTAPAQRPGVVMRDVAGIDASGNVSADGRYVAVVNWSSGNIAVHDLHTGVTRDVTRRDDYDVYNPAISRDGALVAYQSFNGCVQRKVFAPDRGVLCVLTTRGEPEAVPRTVIDSEDIRGVIPMDWSPDGRLIATTVQREDGSAQVGIVRVTDGVVAALRSVDWRGPTRAFFSPDGRYVAFDIPADDATDQRDIEVIAVDGSRGSAVVVAPAQDIVMGWTPDGAHVLFASDRAGAMALWAQRVTDARADGRPTLIHRGLGGAYSLGVTKAGALYWGLQEGGRDVEILTVDLAAAKQIAAPVQPVNAYVGTNFMPEWSRDGRFLAYASRRGFAGNTGFVLGIRDATTGEVRELRPKFAYFNQLSWAPDNSRLATSGIDLRGRRGAFVVDVKTGEVVFIAEGDNPYPKWSPDGERIFYRKSNGGPTNSLIVERDLRSGAERTIAQGELANFSVSPDGQWLAASSGGVLNSAAEAIIVVRRDTGEIREVLRAKPGERLPVWTGLPWTPDSRAVIVRKVAPAPELWVVPISGVPARRVDVDVRGWATGPFGVISLHPDGRQLAGTRIAEERAAAVRVLENLPTAVRP